MHARTIAYTLAKNEVFWLSRYLYKFFQKILLTATYFIGAVFMRLKIEGRENAESVKDGPLLVIANHKSYLDPLLMGMCFPFFSKRFPLRFMTWDDLFKRFFYGLAMRILGAFPAFEKQGMDKSLFIPRKLLKMGGTVIFFPEGQCYREDGLMPAKRGIGVLALRYPNVPILPIAISGTHNVTNLFCLFTRPKVRIRIGKPFRLTDKKSELGPSISSPTDVSANFMAEIEKNYRQIT